MNQWSRLERLIGQGTDRWGKISRLLLPKRFPSEPSAQTSVRDVQVVPPCASVIIPALNEEHQIGHVVRHALADPATAEVIVVDDSSIDATVARAIQAGARVVTSSLLGKGASMADGAREAQQDCLVYLDGDLKGLRSGLISDLARPVVSGEADFVKGRFGRGGGRVTELTAKPMLKVFFPELADFSQPLGGIIAARKSLLAQLTMEDGYGVDIGLLIDAWRANARIAEVDIGHLEHDSQALHDLTSMANEVSRVIFSRARACGRLHVEQITAMYESQRQASGSLDYVMTRRKGRRKLLLLDMDGTVTTTRFAMLLAQATGQVEALRPHLDSGNPDAITRSNDIAQVFRFIHRQKFEDVAKAMPIRFGVVECVNAFKRAGFMVGIVSDSYLVAAEILRKRIFADFALAHTLDFQGDVCTGALTINSAFQPLQPGEREQAGHQPICKGHVLAQFRHSDVHPAFDEIWAVGDNENDRGMLAMADRAWVIDPKCASLALLPGVREIRQFDELAQALAGRGLERFLRGGFRHEAT